MFLIVGKLYCRKNNDLFINKMKIFNWFSNHKDDNSSKPNHGGRITVKKALAFAKEAERLGKFYVFLKRYIEFLLSTEGEIEAKIKEIKDRTKQNLKDEQLIKELWILRYAALHVWFFDLKPPNNQNEVKENSTLIYRAFQSVLESNEKSDYLSWLDKGFAEYSGANELNFNDLKKFKSHFSEKLAEKVPLIAFECTEGRLGGELHDFVIELIMITIQKDQKAFELSDNVSLTEEEVQNIKNIINEMKPTEKDFEEFIDSLN
jgi:transposase